jgi:hypothetical protein
LQSDCYHRLLLLLLMTKFELLQKKILHSLTLWEKNSWRTWVCANYIMQSLFLESFHKKLRSMY